MIRFLFTVLALALGRPAFAAEPPAARISEEKTAPCVSVYEAVPNARGERFGGSGVCIASEGGKSIVVTNNHVFSAAAHPSGGFATDVYPVAATVTCGGKSYAATAVSADRAADIAVVVVDGSLPVAEVADELPKAGTTVWRNGIGTGYRTGTVLAADDGGSDPRFGFVVNGVSESGDSGSGYFNEKNELVAIHCGKNATNNPRGTPVTAVKIVVREKSSPKLFPLMFARLRVRGEPPVAVVVPKADPPKAKVDPNPKAKTVDYQLWLVNGQLVQLPVGQTPAVTAPAASGCPGGACPAPYTPTRRSTFRR